MEKIGVQIVTVKNKFTVYKKEETANAVELLELEENSFDIISQKDLYKIGDKAIYIQPDFCVSDNPIFDNFTKPGGDVSKSMLGKINGTPCRIRAKKFTLSKVSNGDPIYSNGILLPISVLDSNNIDYSDMELLQKELGVYKYEEPEQTNISLSTSTKELLFPEGLYKTDEDNINNVIGKLSFPITLVGTEKVDGSSITIGLTEKFNDGFICSRKIRKPLKINTVIGRKNKNIVYYIKGLLNKTKLFNLDTDLNIYQEIDNPDDFVKNGLPFLNKLKEVECYNVVLRGELSGGKLKGSGNTNNPASKDHVNIKLFGIDLYDGGVYKRIGHDGFKVLTEELNFPTVKEVFVKEFTDKEHLINECNEYFKKNKIEGIVVRDLLGTFSAKVMNNEYDSKK